MIKKILFSLAGVLVIAGTALLFTKSFMHVSKPDTDAPTGQSVLAPLEEQDPVSVEQQIQAVQGARQEAARLQREAEEAALRAQHEAELAAIAAAEESERQAIFEQWSAEANAIADADQFKGIFSYSVIIGASIVGGSLGCDLQDWRQRRIQFYELYPGCPGTSAG